jgi:hypothetical protein
MQLDHLSIRRTRTRTLIQLGGLLEKVGLLDDFGLILGTDLQKDIKIKEPMAALVGALLELQTLLKAEPFQMAVLAEKGIRFLSQTEKGKL